MNIFLRLRGENCQQWTSTYSFSENSLNARSIRELAEESRESYNKVEKLEKEKTKQIKVVKKNLNDVKAANAFVEKLQNKLVQSYKKKSKSKSKKSKSLKK